jgi:arginase
MDIQLINFPMKYGCHTEGADQSFIPLLESGWCSQNTSQVHHVPIIIQDDIHLEHDQTIMNAILHHHDVIKSIYQQHHFPLSYGGDHTCGVGGSSASLSTFQDDVTIIWLDAHADSHTMHSSPSKHIHGMPCAILQGLCEEPLKLNHTPVLSSDRLVYIGLNSYEETEIKHIQDHHIAHLPLKDIQTIGLQSSLEWISQNIKTKYIYLSFDFDVLHPNEFYSVNVNADSRYTSGQGLSLDEVLSIMTHLFTTFQCVGCDVVEYNPTLDHNHNDFKKVLLTLNHLVSLIKENPYDTSSL